MTAVRDQVTIVARMHDRVRASIQLPLCPPGLDVDSDGLVITDRRYLTSLCALGYAPAVGRPDYVARAVAAGHARVHGEFVEPTDKGRAAVTTDG